MSTLRFVVLASLFPLACGGGEDDDDGPAGTVSFTSTNPTTDTGSATSTGDSTTGGDICSAFVGCAELCANQADQQCIDECAELTGSNAAACTSQYCSDLASDCGLDVPDACEKLMSFCGAADTTAGADESPSTSDASTSSSSGSSSTGFDQEACDAYWNCQDNCEDDPDVAACEQTCMDVTMVDYEPCFQKHCDDLLEECANDPRACDELLEDCQQDQGTTTTDTGGTTTDTGGTTSDTGGTTDATGKTT